MAISAYPTYPELCLIQTWFPGGSLMDGDNWQIQESRFDPQAIHHKETVFTIGNGYLGTRGAFEEGFPGDRAGTLIHGVYDDIPIYNTELGNAPNWIDFSIYLDGERFQMDRGQILDFRRVLDLRNGVLNRQVRWRSPTGKTIDLSFERFASLADPHLMGLRVRLASLDFTGGVEFRAGLPGQMDNQGFLHWDWAGQGGIEGQGAYLVVQTRATKISVCEAFQLNFSSSGRDTYHYWDSQWTPTIVARAYIEQGNVVTAEKLVSIFTSRDTDDPEIAAREALEIAARQGYDGLSESNEFAWQAEWENSDITIEGDDEADRRLRYSLFQLLISAPRQDDKVSIPAKTLSGFVYRGHAFWDTEIFVLPFFIYTRPEIARNLVLYRYHTLSGARRKARLSGFEGAMYAWESAATGDETTPRWVPHQESSELIRIWCGDIEHHITADVAYGVHHYWQVTGDDEFMRSYGAEMILDTARFWGSRVEWDQARGVYEINDVIGPDEYHDHVDNNAFTNLLARWNLQTALEVLGWLREADPAKAAELEERLDLTSLRLAHWEEVIQKLYLGYDEVSGLFEQFEGFFQLKDVDLRDFEPRTKSMQVILGIEGVQDYQIIKQPDVLMLLYLLRSRFTREIFKANWDYYTPRTDLTYGSSLGPAVQAAIAAQMGDIQAAYLHFIHATRTDLEDARGNAGEGIHAATAGGLWQAAVFGFGGLQVNPEGPVALPHLPPGWKRLNFRVWYRGERSEFDLRAGEPVPASNLRDPDVTPVAVTNPRLPILGAIFDLDGVLTDTSEFHYLGWKRLADEEGLPFDREANEALRGVSRRESLRLLLKDRQVPEGKQEQLMERKNRYYQESIASLTPANLLPGARALLEDLRAAGVKTAIGSASKNARQVVERLQLQDLVDAISDGYSVERAKPAPDLFIHAAGQLDIPVEQCIVFEDAEAGVIAALAAGMWAAGIGPAERVGAAHVVLPDLNGITWKSLQEQIEFVSQEGNSTKKPSG
jgi:kojibiose phosphorylase